MKAQKNDDQRTDVPGTSVHATFFLVNCHQSKGIVDILKAGTELGQAQLQLELVFTLIKVCFITLMITNYHYI